MTFADCMASIDMMQVTLIPSAIGYYLYVKGHERQTQVLAEIAALGHNDMAKVDAIARDPR